MMVNRNSVSIVNQIRKKYPVVFDCEEQGCKLSLKKLDQNSIVILKGEKVREDEGRAICDRLIFKENTIIMIGLVELKGKRPDSSKVREQLNGGLELAFKIIGECRIGSLKPYVILILLSKKGISHFDERKLRKPIPFKGKSFNIALGKDRDSFSQLLIKYKDYIVQIP